MRIVAAALDDQLGELFASSGPFLFYIVIWSLIFVGTGLLVGVFIPFITGDSLLFAAGIITAASDNINPVVLATGVGLAAFFGDQVGFVIGRKLGRPYLDRKTGPRMVRAVARTEAFYARWGWSAVVIARFIPVMRALIPVIAGIGKMNYYKFLSANVTGAIVWGVGMTFAGYYAATIPVVRSFAYAIGFTFIGLSLLVGVRTWWRDRQVARQGGHSG